MTDTNATSHHWINSIVENFLRGHLSVLLLVVSVIAGGFSLWITPREEDPQIVVPVADVYINMPGASAAEVERQVSTRLEKLLYQIDGVEYVYSMSYPSLAIVTVRFYVGQDRERSWVKIQNKIQSNIDQVPPGVVGWVVKPVEIDDVPIVNLTLYSNRYSDYELRRMAEELEIRLQSVKNAGRTYLVGGRSREITVQLSLDRMTSRSVSLRQVSLALRGANASLPSGDLVNLGKAVKLDAGRFLATAAEVEDLVVGVWDGRPIYLKEVADVTDGPEEPRSYTRFFLGSQGLMEGDPEFRDGENIPADIERYKDYPAVTVSVAKRRGTNAVWVSEEVRKKADEFAKEVLPDGAYLRVTRDYGKTANDKVNELVESLAAAVLIVVALLAFALGWREAIIIAIAIPITFSFTLLINYLTGYTINRVTLFALILSLGLVVDDPIVDVENIHRHFMMRLKDPFRSVLDAVNEVRPPVIVATLAVILSFIPLFFITGMMGPYMAPMALNVPVAMLMSLMVAFTITPWLAYHFMKPLYYRHSEKPFEMKESFLYRAYLYIMLPVFERSGIRKIILLVLCMLLGFCGWLVLDRRVPLKMLPLDNRNELQVMIDMPEGTALEDTEAVTRAFGDYLVRAPETTDVTMYTGLSSPIDFNGLIRHYYLRQGPNVADIRFNLIEKNHRAQQNHAIALRLRDDLQKIADAHGATIKIVEAPPGPPVFATLVAEIYGKSNQPYSDLIAAAPHVRKMMAETPGVVDTDDVTVAAQGKKIFQVDQEKAALHGITAQEIVSTIEGLISGDSPTSLRLPDQVQPVNVRLRLSQDQRKREDYMKQILFQGMTGHGVFLSELGAFVEEKIEQPIYHKNLKPVVYVFGETAGVAPPETVVTLAPKIAKEPQLEDLHIEWAGEGEWEVTLRAFRDLGAAFGVAVLGIYILLLYQTGSYLLPAIQLVALPLSVIGILPGFWLLNLFTATPVGHYQNPIYFTATAMIGMIALSGIATRNSILLIEFVEERRKEGKGIVESLIQTGAMRSRPILLTSLASMLGAWPITLDPIFSGLAWALIFGLLVSTLFTLVVVPMIYYMAYSKTFNPPLA